MIWTLIGLVVGGALGWWFSAFSAYVLFGAIFGWLIGLTFSDAGTGAEH